MSRNLHGIPIIEAEPDFICSQCGKIAETRPYGPNGEEICFECGQKNPLETCIQTQMRLFGEKDRKEAERIARIQLGMPAV